MKSAILVLKEQIKNFYLIRRLSLYELKSANNSNYLGMTWEILNPLIQILIYWFVFGYGIRERADIEIEPGVFIQFLPWMLSGFILWFFFYQSTIQGSKSVYTRLKMLAKMNFPMSVIPNFVIFSQIYIHIFMMIIAIIILHLFNYYVNIFYLQLIYFLFATVVFSYALALITSTLSTIIRDIHMFLNSSLRMLLYLSPILWNVASSDDVANWIKIVMKLNPLYYLIEGYRSGFLGLGWYFIDNWIYTLYFWGVTFILFLIGASIHVKFRKYFIDFL